MKYLHTTLFAAFPIVANADGKEIFVNAVIGAGVVIGLSIIFGSYRLGKFLAIKLKPDMNPLLQRLCGVSLVFAVFSLWGALAG